MLSHGAMMLRHRSIRVRLTLWYAVILTAALALFGGLLWVAMRDRLIGELDREMRSSAAQFENYFRGEVSEAAEGQLRDELEEFCQALPASSYVSLRGASGFTFHHPAAAVRPAADFRLLERQFVSGGETFDFEIAEPMAEVLHTVDLLRYLLLSLLPVVVAVACVGGAWLSGRALRPVQALTEAASAISAENLSSRLPDPETNDELSRLTEVLNGMLAHIESAVKTLSQFVADASHELRTPVAVIRTTSELALRRERTPEMYRDSLRDVAAEAQRMTILIEDLLTLARSDTGRVEMPLEPLDLRSVLRDVCTEIAGIADVRQVRIAAHLGKDSSAITGNPAALHRLFLLLIENAVKYSPAGAEVLVSMQTIDSAVNVAVMDSGPGISSSDLPHIFQRFYRADRSRASAGHGLGLALAESIARMHGASIQVESREGTGSTFRVSFRARSVSENLQVAPLH